MNHLLNSSVEITIPSAISARCRFAAGIYELRMSEALQEAGDELMESITPDRGLENHGCPQILSID